MKIHTNQVVCAPTNSAYLEHAAYGIISPKVVITAVDTIRPTTPDVKLSIRIERAELTVTFPSKIVQRRRLPFFLRGRILFAYAASYSSYALVNGGYVSNSRFFTSRPSKPRFRPENSPDIVARMTINRKSVQGTGGFGSGGQSGNSFFCSTATVFKMRNISGADRDIFIFL